jgi:2-polyprenyl-6-hydroxyphenyl methylase/3-demethylubiquinone-9 3-methyltransferase
MGMGTELPEFRLHGFDDKFKPLTEANLQASAHNEQYIRFLTLWLGKPLKGLRVLDLGCGRGELTGALRARGARAFGIEVDERFVESGKILDVLFQDELPVLSTVDREGRSIFPSEFFDLVISDQVLEHVADLEAVTAEVARVLKPGG